MKKLSTAMLAVTASLALGAMIVSASAGHGNNGGNGGGNKQHSNGGGGNGGDHMHNNSGHGHGHGHWRGGLWIPYYGGYDDDAPRCWWRHGHRHCRY